MMQHIHVSCLMRMEWIMVDDPLQRHMQSAGKHKSLDAGLENIAQLLRGNSLHSILPPWSYAGLPNLTPKRSDSILSRLPMATSACVGINHSHPLPHHYSARPARPALPPLSCTLLLSDDLPMPSSGAHALLSMLLFPYRLAPHTKMGEPGREGGRRRERGTIIDHICPPLPSQGMP